MKIALCVKVGHQHTIGLEQIVFSTLINTHRSSIYLMLRNVFKHMVEKDNQPARATQIGYTCRSPTLNIATSQPHSTEFICIIAQVKPEGYACQDPDNSKETDFQRKANLYRYRAQ